jgi:thiamine-phosphate pyrophosphorylase
MAANQPQWPREWLMTDERTGVRLWEAIEALPAGAGIIYRNYATPDDERSRLADRISRACRKRGLILGIARNVRLAEFLGADLVHNPVGASGALPVSRSAHSLKEASDACSAGAALLFVSPVHATRSHPERRPLGHAAAVRIAQSCPVPAIALGGVNRDNFAPLRREGFYGWAGIDAWLKDEVRT